MVTFRCLPALLVLFEVALVKGFTTPKIAGVAATRATHQTLFSTPSSSALSTETIARLEKDYRDLRDAFDYQANYNLKHQPTEDSLEQAVYLTHLQRFQQETEAQDAEVDHEHALETLKHIQEDYEKLHDSFLIQDFEVESAQEEEQNTSARQQRALNLVRLLEVKEKDLRDALEELRQANDVDQVTLAEIYKHEALLQSLKLHLVYNHDPSKGKVAF